MVSTPERFTDNSPIPPGPSVTIINPSAAKSLHLFTEVLDVKNKSAVRRVGDPTSNHKAIRAGSMLWSSITKSKVHTKINEIFKKSLYNWILQHPQVVQYPIANDYLKVSIDGNSEPQLVPKLLLQVSIWELHNNMVVTQEEGGIKEARYADNNIIISDSTLRSILKTQLNNMS